ncbi:MAG: PepSY domain-containing protein [Lysobacteraceae bacterium]
MRSIQLLTLAAAMAACTVVSAHPLACTIHPPKGASDQALAKLATVSKETAQAAALATVKPSNTATIASAELEAEHGCLIWSFDVKKPKLRGIQEITVDAGNGKVLSSSHETPRDETAEASKEAAEAQKK